MEKSQNIIVIGAGIVGVSTAIWLQRTGHNVKIIDQEGFAAKASYGNAGLLAVSAVIPVTVPGLLMKAPKMLFDSNQPLFLRWSYLPKLVPWLFRYLKLANHKDMKRIARDINTLMYDSPDQHMALAKGTDAERYIKFGNYLHCYDTKKDFEKDVLSWKVRRDLGVEYEELDADALGKYDPALAGKFGYAVSCLNHGFISDPGAYVKALGDHFIKQGGELVVADVTDIPKQNGKANGVQTKQHGLYEASQVVVCGGAWSAELTKKLGHKAMLEAERGYHLEFTNASVELRSPIMVTSKKFAMHSMDGRLRCAGIVELGGLEAGPSKAPIELLKRQVGQLFPELEYEETSEWLGHRPSTPDSLPHIGALSGISNVWTGFGHQHLGLTGGAKTGRWLSQLISGETPNEDLTAYKPDRF